MSPAPRFSTADIAKGAQRTEETTAIERVEPNAGARMDESAVPLFAADASADFQRRWDAIQASFVDDPRHAVEEADALVAETMQKLAENFARERQRLEEQLALDRPRSTDQPSDATTTESRATDTDTRASTEDLRVALRHYRSFFKRLLSV